MNRWKIGDVTIARVIEVEGPTPGDFLLRDATPEAVRKEAWLAPHFADETGMLRASVHALVVESDGMRIVVDTCVGNDKKRAQPFWNQLHGPFLTDLAKAGFSRDSIDRVICTHLHVDHVGWNTMLEAGGWVPTFSKARYLIGGREWDFFSTVEQADLRAPVEDSVRPVVDARRVDLVDSDYRVTREVWLEPTPGHTPGHVSVRISSRGEEAVITGDLMHHPIQCAHPDWASNFDSDPDLARKTRRAFLARYADRPVKVFGTHFATPSVGRIVSAGSAWRYEAI